MKHYHVSTVVNMFTALASVRYDNYEDSLQAYVALSNTLYAHRNRPGNLSIENARQATENGEGEAALIGPEILAVLWCRCETDCVSPTWN